MNYARRGTTQSTATFRVGLLSLTFAVFVIVAVCIVGFATYHRWLPDGLLNIVIGFGGIVSLGGIGTGVGGLFQKDGRLFAILGLIWSLAELLLLPAFLTA